MHAQSVGDRSEFLRPRPFWYFYENDGTSTVPKRLLVNDCPNRMESHSASRLGINLQYGVAFFQACAEVFSLKRELLQSKMAH
jgi:hypothetical protein